MRNVRTDAEDLAHYIARNQALGELLTKAESARDFYKSEVERLHTENDGLLARSREAEQYGTIKSKELIVMRDKLSALENLDASAAANARDSAQKVKNPRALGNTSKGARTG
jgi:DNA uptake protein ComE-like DNA-binding protein